MHLGPHSLYIYFGSTGGKQGARAIEFDHLLVPRLQELPSRAFFFR